MRSHSNRLITPIALVLVAFLTTFTGCENFFSRIGPPDVITDLVATPGDNTVTLSWTNPTNADFDYCEITYGSASDEIDFEGTVDNSGTAISGLTNGIEYTFTVTAVDTRGRLSDGWSTTATPADTTPPGPVTALTAEAGYGSIQLSWTAPDDLDVENYIVTATVSGGTIDPLSATVATPTCSFGRLATETEYSVTVRAVDDDGLQGEAISETVVTLGVSGTYVAVGEDRIYGTSTEMEYSTDNRVTWQACDAGSSYTTVTFSAGDEVWIREADDPATERFLGTVSATTGVDLYPTGPVWVGSGSWSDVTTGNPGDALNVKFNYANIGTVDGGWQSAEVVGYLSPDQEITAADTELFRTTQTIDTTLGEHTSFSSWFPFAVPDVASGVYYVGVTLDTGEAITEMVEDNNTSPSATVAELRIGDDAALPAGAIKVYNSWGTSTGGWQNVGGDGHYWITYQTLKQLQPNIYYYYNDFSHEYEPTVLAVFQLTHNYRDECYITVGLGDPADPVIWKDMQPRFLRSYTPGDFDLYSGHVPFPANALALDISEFAHLINDYDLYLQIENQGATAGTVDSFSVEFYSDYDAAPFETITGGTGAITASATSSFTAATHGALTATQLAAIEPLSRADIFGTSFNEYTPTEAELQRDMARSGVYQPGEDYNVIVGGFGTGLVPPTEAQWRSMVKLSGISTTRAMGTLPYSIDLSATQYFPPVGNQGAEGSCVAFSMGYYIHTYMEARERGLDLSGIGWDGSVWPGEPDSSLDTIMSPDFVYHQINSGVDGGSSYFDAVSLLTLVGASSWQEMPYDTADHTSWPSEAAFREAARYRGRAVGTHFWDDTHAGYFTIEADADIDLLKQLLNEGYAVSISVNAGTSDYGLYEELNDKDVIDDSTLDYGGYTNHANTVVGYKEGSAWDAANPDG